MTDWPLDSLDSRPCASAPTNRDRRECFCIAGVRLKGFDQPLKVRVLQSRRGAPLCHSWWQQLSAGVDGDSRRDVWENLPRRSLLVGTRLALMCLLYRMNPRPRTHPKRRFRGQWKLETFCFVLYPPFDSSGKDSLKTISPYKTRLITNTGRTIEDKEIKMRRSLREVSSLALSSTLSRASSSFPLLVQLLGIFHLISDHCLVCFLPQVYFDKTKHMVSEIRNEEISNVM